MRGAFRFLLSVSCAAFLSAVVSCTGTKEPAAVPPEKTKTVEPVKTQPKAEPVKPDQQPKKEAEPQVVAQPVPDTPTDAPAQYFFPHGHRGQIIAYDKFLVLAASWTRGDGIAFFDISDPKHPFYAYGLPSAGYIGDVVRRGDVLYFATGYSIQTVKMPFRKTILKKITHDDDCRPHILENTLIAFPGGNVRRLALSKDSLYVTAPDGLRKYTLAKDGRPEYSHTYRELKQLSAFAISGNNLYFVRSSMKNNVYRSSLANPEKTEAVRVAKAPVEKLITAPDGQAFMFAGKKLMRCDMRDEVFPGKII